MRSVKVAHSPGEKASGLAEEACRWRGEGAFAQVPFTGKFPSQIRMDNNGATCPHQDNASREGLNKSTFLA
jgi:hypothetical protein